QPVAPQGAVASKPAPVAPAPTANPAPQSVAAAPAPPAASASAAAGVTLPEPKAEVPARFARIVTRTKRYFLTKNDQDLFAAYADFIDAVNEGQPEAKLEIYAQDLDNAFKKAPLAARSVGSGFPQRPARSARAGWGGHARLDIPVQQRGRLLPPDSDSRRRIPLLRRC